MKKNIPWGVKFICYIYLANTLFYVLSLLLFYNRIIVFGSPAGFFISWSIRGVFIFVPVYLYFRLKGLKQDAWFTAMYFQSFFIINNLLGILESRGFLHEIVRISGLYNSVSYSASAILISVLNIGLNLLIFGYLFKIKTCFFSR